MGVGVAQDSMIVFRPIALLVGAPVPLNEAFEAAASPVEVSAISVAMGYTTASMSARCLRCKCLFMPVLYIMFTSCLRGPVPGSPAEQPTLGGASYQVRRCSELSAPDFYAVPGGYETICACGLGCVDLTAV